MKQATVFLDESGDFGMSLDKPVQQGGSSRFLTVAAVVADGSASRKVNRLIHTLYTERQWSKKREKKWKSMGKQAKLDFASRAAKLAQSSNGRIRLLASTIKKENFPEEYQSDKRLLNYILILAALKEIKEQYESLIIESDNSDLLDQDTMASVLCKVNPKTTFQFLFRDSRKYEGIQFADMLAGLVNQKFETGECPAWDILQPYITHDRILF